MSDFGDLLRSLPTTTQTPTLVSNPSSGVSTSADLERILAVPRRLPWHEGGQYSPVTSAIKKSGGSLSLLPIQEWALSEASSQGGLFAPIAAGAGKTLLSFLLPVVMGAKTTVLLVPASLREKTYRDYEYYSQHFNLPQLVGAKTNVVSPYVIHLLSYSKLGVASSSGILDTLSPTLVVADECHNLKHRSAVRTRRVLRYFRKMPGTTFCGMSGTITSRSVRDYAHLLRLALHDASPLPHDYFTLIDWASALDPGPDPLPPGRLHLLCKPLESVREGFSRRLVETRGVVSSKQNTTRSALFINKPKVVTPTKVLDALTDLRETWRTPGGEELTDALSFYRASIQISAGFYYVWDWGSVTDDVLRREWLDRRAAYHAELRTLCRAHERRTGLDSRFLVESAIHSGRLQSHFQAPWYEIKPQASPTTTPIWIDDFLVREAVSWGQKEKGIIWYYHHAFGQRLAKDSGFPLFGPGDIAIQDETGSRTVVASVKAHGTGKNLQAWSSAYITELPTTGASLEQLLAREHREGQLADEVHYHIPLHTPEVEQIWRKVNEEAKYIQETTGSQQRLCFANRTF